LKVCIVGSLNTDMVISTPHIPNRGETVFGEKLDMLPGGRGANAVTTLSKLGKEGMLIGCIGHDSFGDDLLTELRKNQVNISHIKRTMQASTGTTIIMIDDVAVNTMVGMRGANSYLSPEDIDKAVNGFKDYGILLAQMEMPEETIVHAMQEAKKNNVLVVLDPKPAKNITMKVLEATDIIIPNEQETKYMTGIEIKNIDDAIQAGRYFESLGISQSIIKMGQRGALVYTPTRIEHVAAIPVKVVDSVVGGAFSGALACAFLEGKDIFKATRFACVVSALKVTRFGAQIGIPTLEELNEFIEENNLYEYLNGFTGRLTNNIYHSKNGELEKN
jgi:ribokinase